MNFSEIYIAFISHDTTHNDITSSTYVKSYDNIKYEYIRDEWERHDLSIKPVKYYQGELPDKNIEPITIDDDAFFLYFKSINTGHAITHFINSYFDYKNVTANNTRTIYISENINDMPFLLKLIKLMLPDSQIRYIKKDTIYKFNKVYIPESIFFTFNLIYPKEIDISNNIHVIDSSAPVLECNGYGILREPLHYFEKAIETIYEENKDRYEKHDNIILVKSNYCKNFISPERKIYLSDDVINLIKKYNFKMIIPENEEDVTEFIVKLRYAKNIITSYGNINCTNRFFFNPNAIIKVIGNMSYKEEYNNEHYHTITHSYRAKKYLFFLERSDNLSEEELEYIINY
jgi:hypothetical protein